MTGHAQPIDLLVVGGGINGVGIARDAAGRGLSVRLVERSDLAAATSSASSKLIHGGLRYLEHGEFRLVRESLAEREVLLAAAPHVVRPLRFVLPVHGGLRPPWLLRAGLFLYDHIGGRQVLPATRTVRRGRDTTLDPLADRYRLGFEYSDCWADDARLVILNAIDARERGASITPRHALTAARRVDALWEADISGPSGERSTLTARIIVNAAGPWVDAVLRATGGAQRRSVRLVKGSHAVVRRLYAGSQAFTLQNADGRIVFLIPYEGDFTLVGTTDIPFDGEPSQALASDAEMDYLCALASDYLRKPMTRADLVWRYAGVRPLHGGGASPSTVTRDYAFDLDAPADKAPLLSVFGGKLTTYRKLAEHVLAQLRPFTPAQSGPWTRQAALPGGELEPGGLACLEAEQVERFSHVPADLVRRWCRAYGARIGRVAGGAQRTCDLGEEIAPQLYEAELAYLRDQEWARTAQDVLWRRTKLGLALEPRHIEAVTRWMGE